MANQQNKGPSRGLRAVWHGLGVVVVMLCVAMVLARVFAPNAWRRGTASFFEFAGGQRGGFVSVATAGKQGAYHAWGTLLRTKLKEEGAHDLAVLESSGSLENLELVRSGETDFGLIQGGLREDMSGLTAVASLNRQYVHLVVRDGSPIRRLGDLAGKRVWLGPEKSGFAALGKLVLDFASLEPPAQIMHGDTDALAEEMVRGQVDAAFTVYGLYAPFIDDLLRQDGYRLVPIPEADAIAQHIPGVYVASIPPCAYGPNRTMPAPAAGPLRTLAVDTILIARPDVSHGAVKAVLHAIYDVEFQKVAGLSGLSEAQGRHVVDLPLHAAAEAYYRRHAPITSDMFEIASFFLAAVVCVASAVHFLVGRHRKHKSERLRQRITPYFENMLSLCESATSASDESALLAALESMKAMQRKAEREWLDGALDTEDMENLYLVYGIRTGNTYRALFEKYLLAMRKQCDRLEDALNAQNGSPGEGASGSGRGRDNEQDRSTETPRD